MSTLNHFVLKFHGFPNEVSATSLAAILWGAAL